MAETTHFNQALAGPSDQNPQPQRRDPLTGFFERDYLVQALESALQKSRREPVAATLALLQLENFYEIRAWVGKSEANLLLSDLAQVVKRTLPSSVLLCRCQHYEFAALFTNECSINARLITDRLKAALLSAVSNIIPPQLELRCVVGFAEVDKRIPSAEVMFARARHHLGRSRGSPPALASAPSTASAEPGFVLQRIQQGLRDSAFRLNFQPTVCFSEDGLQHYEIRCELTPDEFSLPASVLFEVAVQNALGEEIDRWVIAHALQLLRQRRQPGLRFTVNITLNSVVSSRFFEWLNQSLEACGELGEQLVFQISEIDVLIAQHHMDYFCEKLSRLRIRLCINHFGCTTDPFRYLSLLRAHFVKLDVSLLEKVNSQPRQRAQLKSVVAKLHERGLQVIAPVVESMPIVPTLWRAHIDFVQGYCMRPPGDSLDFEFLSDMTLTLR